MKIEIVLFFAAVLVHFLIHLKGIRPADAAKRWLILSLFDFSGALVCLSLEYLQSGGIQRTLGRFQTANFMGCLVFLSVGITDLLTEWTIRRYGVTAVTHLSYRAMLQAIFLAVLLSAGIFLEIYHYQPWVCVLLVGILLIIMAPLYYGYWLWEKGA